MKKLVAILIVAALVLAGAATIFAALRGVEGPAGPPDQRSSTPGPAPDAGSAPSAELESFYAQVLDWSTCDNAECAVLEVPLDYAEPTDETIELRHGLLFRAESSIPHFRVQHVDVRQGPLQRSAGIVELVISTASAATDATLPGVEPERADAIRRVVLARAEADDAV